ncbi:hypothetical protein NA57DRAFT_81812 [Rhizodiscina lignyota]|uniref:Uncharacterized protein n=1 Tax=Rhizodiscina lignyota TaxID=1504668 RepID=A0A9P4I548_9PEZI|nr:hypothetical protein NA57DRAFT_81812 [Rhizodiscina lignyota]
MEGIGDFSIPNFLFEEQWYQEAGSAQQCDLLTEDTLEAPGLQLDSLNYQIAENSTADDSIATDLTAIGTLNYPQAHLSDDQWPFLQHDGFPYDNNTSTAGGPSDHDLNSFFFDNDLSLETTDLFGIMPDNSASLENSILRNTYPDLPNELQQLEPIHSASRELESGNIASLEQRSIAHSREPSVQEDTTVTSPADKKRKRGTKDSTETFRPMKTSRPGSKFAQLPGFQCFVLKPLHQPKKAEVSAERRREIAQVRRIGACLRCRFLKQPRQSLYSMSGAEWSNFKACIQMSPLDGLRPALYCSMQYLSIRNKRFYAVLPSSISFYSYGVEF